MREVANINLVMPRRSSEGVTERGVAASSWTREEKRRRLEKTHGTNSQLIFVFAKSKLPSYWRWAFFFHLPELLESWQNAIFTE